MLFIEAMTTVEVVERVASSFDVPLLYNFAERGKSPLIPVPELERMGFKIVIFPASAILTVCTAVAEVMREIKERGTTERLVGNMVSAMELFETVGLSEMLATGARYETAEQLTG